MSNNIVPPHGGQLVRRVVSDSEAPRLRERAAKAVRIVLDARELSDLELLAEGAASPLKGFLGSRDYASVLESMRLADGTVWPLPLTLAVSEDTKSRLQVGQPAALYDADGRLWGTIAVADIYQRDVGAEARSIYRTEDPAHPGVAYLQSRPTWLIGGDVDVLPLPDQLPFAKYRLTPTQLRAAIAERGWSRVAGFQTRNPIHRAHEHLTKLALEVSDGLVIHPLVGETKNDDVPAAVRFKVYETLIEKYYPKDRTLLAAFPAAMRYAGPREALFHAIVRKNYGINQLIVGRDHAGVGNYYGPLEAQEIFSRFTAAELGVTPLKFDPTFYCRACDNLASARTCPHDKSTRVELSGTRVRELLRAGESLPKEFTRPEVAEVLRAHYLTLADATANVAKPTTSPAPSEAKAGAGAANPVASGGSPAKTGGFVLWFTGLSGAGKSTLAQYLQTRLSAAKAVEILDGDEVRTYLSKGLGFSKEDRDTNIRRIGYVARLLAKHGVGTITAAISPYAQTRDEVKQLAQADGIAFVEVYVNAELQALVDRDVKGLYKKAIAGEVKNFTGVSDPYEPPTAPDVEVRSDRETVEQSAQRIWDVLAARGLVSPGPVSGRVA